MNDKVKSLFFSQYALQEVWCNDIFYVPIRLSFDKIQHQFETDKDYLLLRDISQLTDEEAMQIANFWWEGGSDWEISRDVMKSNIIVYDTENKLDIIIHCDYYSIENCDDDSRDSGSGETLLKISDYLRSIAILLPFTYLSETNQPITLTPAEIIALGWAKVKSNEQ